MRLPIPPRPRGRRRDARAPRPGRGSITRLTHRCIKKVRVPESCRQHSNQTWPLAFKPCNPDVTLVLLPERGPPHDHPPRRDRRPRHRPCRPASSATRRRRPRSAAPTPCGNGPASTSTAKPASLRLRADADRRRPRCGPSMASSRPSCASSTGPKLRLALQNDTPKPLSLHFHGVRGPNAMDGVGGLTQEPVAPGGSHRRTASRPPDAGTYPHPPLRARRQRRAAGARPVGPPDRRGAEPAAGRSGRGVLIDDWSLNEDGSLAPFDDVRRQSGRTARQLAHRERQGHASTGSRRRRAAACGCGSPMPATPGSCACASTG